MFTSQAEQAEGLFLSRGTVLKEGELKGDFPGSGWRRMRIVWVNAFMPEAYGRCSLVMRCS